MKKQTLTRIIALILAAVLALGCFLLPAMAAGTEPPGTVTGNMTVETVSACVLVKAPVAEETEPMSESEAIGSIGGADGPTAIFVTGGFSSRAVVGSLLILIAAAVLVLSGKRKK